jgi:hypothetical protein
VTARAAALERSTIAAASRSRAPQSWGEWPITLTGLTKCEFSHSQDPSRLLNPQLSQEEGGPHLTWSSLALGRGIAGADRS